MTISSLLTLFAVILAIIAFISENDRRFALLKFTGFDWLLIVFIFLWINYLIGYDWFRGHIDFLSRFEYKGYPTAGAYAYLISITTLIWLSWKIYKGPFSESNREKILSYYNQLLLKSEYSLLTILIEKYHYDDILEYLERVKKIHLQNLTGLEVYDGPEEERAYNKAINTAQLKIAASVYAHIINSDAFIEEVAKKYPYFFAGIIKKLDSQRVANIDLIHLFVSKLMNEKNTSFFREIRNIGNLTQNDSYVIEKNQQPILYSLLNNINVAKINYAWSCVAEPAIMEMQEETKKDFSPLRESVRDYEDVIRNYRMYYAIIYFDIMVRQAIVADLDDSLNMTYYWFFTQYIIQNIKEPDLYAENVNIPSKNHKMLEEIISRQTDWLKCIVKSEKGNLLESVFKNIGLCVFEIATTELLTDKTKSYLIDWVFADSVFLHGEGEIRETIVANAINNWIKYFKTPITGFVHNSKRNEYIKILRYVFDHRDAPKFDGVVAESRVQRFEQEVLNPLEILKK